MREKLWALTSRIRFKIALLNYKIIYKSAEIRELDDNIITN